MVKTTAFFEFSSLTGIPSVIRNGIERYKGDDSEVTKGGMFWCSENNENRTLPRLSKKEMSVKVVSEEQVT